jgi:hypothetical protein
VGPIRKKSPSGGRNDIFRDFRQKICGRLFAPVRQRNSRADFAGLDGDVAQSGETNGWVGDRV